MPWPVLLCLAATAVSGATTGAAPPPNVVMIISDDQGWTDFGFMGHPVIQTPNLDRLARQSLVFPHGYVPSSLCRPSLATLITGLLPHQHTLTGNDPPALRGKADLPRFRAQQQQMIRAIDRVPTLPRLLARHKYVSFQSGKWWEGSYRRGGFTDGMTHGDPKRGGRHGDEGLGIGRRGMQPIYDFIETAGTQPFLVWYAPFLPHRPHDPPARLLDRYRQHTESIHIARYWAMCEWFDETCGQLLDYLDRTGRADNTLVVFVTDNGWIQSRSTPNHAPRSKRSPNEGGIRTPVLVRWPARVTPKTVDVPVSSVDLVPTILAACGSEPTAAMPGVNLLDEVAVAAREVIYGEIFTHNAVRIDRPAANLKYRWCVQGRWKLIVPHRANVPDGKPELYDLQADPHETNNLAGSQPDRVETLRQRIDKCLTVCSPRGTAGG